MNQLSNIESGILQADRQSCFALTGMSFEFFAKVLYPQKVVMLVCWFRMMKGRCAGGCLTAIMAIEWYKMIFLRVF